MIKKLGKRGIFLLIYAFIILAILLYILFLAPTSMFVKETEGAPTPKTFTNFKTQQQHLLEKQYDYEYNILYGNTTYKCQGTLSKEKETGTCTQPKEISYDQDNKKQLKFNLNNLDLAYIFTKIENIEPKETKYGKSRSFIYNLELDNFTTDIIIYTDFDEITNIQISNAYEVYDIKFTNIKY